MPIPQKCLPSPLLILSAAICMAIIPELALAAELDPLAQDQWQKRPLIVVTETAHDPLLLKVRKALESPPMREAFRERDMVLYTVIAGNASRNDVALSNQQSKALVESLAVKPPVLILIGKDGGQKYLAHDLDNIEAIFELIDSMPMRKTETNR